MRVSDAHNSFTSSGISNLSRKLMVDCEYGSAKVVNVTVELHSGPSYRPSSSAAPEKDLVP